MERSATVAHMGILPPDWFYISIVPCGTIRVSIEAKVLTEFNSVKLSNNISSTIEQSSKMFIQNRVIFWSLLNFGIKVLAEILKIEFKVS